MTRKIEWKDVRLVSFLALGVTALIAMTIAIVALVFDDLLDAVAALEVMIAAMMCVGLWMLKKSQSVSIEVPVEVPAPTPRWSEKMDFARNVLILVLVFVLVLVLSLAAIVKL